MNPLLSILRTDPYDRAKRIEFSRRMESLRADNADEPQYKEIWRGWRFGSEEFVARILDKIEGKLGESQTPREREESMEARAGRIIAGELKEAGWNAQRLKKERKSHPVKVKLAQRLRRETTMSLKWIAETLSMGTWSHVSNLLRPDKNHN